MKSKSSEKFGIKLREERHKQKISQEELADRAGVHRTYIGILERGEKNITIDNIAKMLKALNVSFKDFFSNF